MIVNTDLPITLKPGKLRSIGMIFMFACFTAGSIWISDVKPLIGYLCAGLFGSGLLIFIINLFPNSSYLELNQDGFTMCNLYRKSTTRWVDVEKFFVIEMSHNHMVAWNYTKAYKNQKTGRKISKAMANAEAALPDTYGMKANELAELMNLLLERAYSD